MTLRAAFSNINAWKTLQSDVELAGQVRIDVSRVYPVAKAQGCVLAEPV